MKTLKSHILAWLALAVFCAVVSCKRNKENDWAIGGKTYPQRYLKTIPGYKYRCCQPDNFVFDHILGDTIFVRSFDPDTWASMNFKTGTILRFMDTGIYNYQNCCDTTMHGDTVYMTLLDTTDNDWIKDHSEIKNLDE